jgi:hypothetical protein
MNVNCDHLEIVVVMIFNCEPGECLLNLCYLQRTKWIRLFVCLVVVKQRAICKIKSQGINVNALLLKTI